MKSTFSEFFESLEMNRYVSLMAYFQSLEMMMFEELELRKTAEILRLNGIETGAPIGEWKEVENIVSSVERLYRKIIVETEVKKSFEGTMPMIQLFEERLKKLILFEEYNLMQRYFKADAVFEEMESLGLFGLDDQMLNRLPELRRLLQESAYFFNFMESAELLVEYEELIKTMQNHVLLAA